ncbi:MAG: DUF4286 family protein, partial [Bacteroidota bacterium]
MLIYNVTVKIDNSAKEEWLNWMQEIHIPDVMNTGCFQKWSINHLLGTDETEGTTFAIQYTCDSMQTLEHYQNNFAKKLQEEHKV